MGGKTPINFGAVAGEIYKNLFRIRDMFSVKLKFRFYFGFVFVSALKSPDLFGEPNQLGIR